MKRKRDDDDDEEEEVLKKINHTMILITFIRAVGQRQPHAIFLLK